MGGANRGGGGGGVVMTENETLRRHRLGNIRIYMCGYNNNARVRVCICACVRAPMRASVRRVTSAISPRAATVVALSLKSHQRYKYYTAEARS